MNASESIADSTGKWLEQIEYLFRLVAPGLVIVVAAGHPPTDATIFVTTVVVLGAITYAWIRGMSRTRRSWRKPWKWLRWLFVGRYDAYMDGITRAYRIAFDKANPAAPLPKNRLPFYVAHQERFVVGLPEIARRARRDSDQFWCLSACAVAAMVGVGRALAPAVTQFKASALVSSLAAIRIWDLAWWTLALVTLRVGADCLLRSIRVIDLHAIDSRYQAEGQVGATCCGA